MPFDISHWRPSQEKEWDRRADGGVKVAIYEESGVVEIFTYPGDDKHREFTHLAMWIYPYCFSATLDRHYSERWLRRLARDFAWQCSKIAEKAR